jgi:hypothetical protein
MDRRIRVLAVGMVDSPHFVHWLRQFKDSDIDFYVFPSTPNRRVHIELLDLAGDKSSKCRVTIATNVCRYSLVIWLADVLLRGLVRSSLLRSYIRQTNPGIVHALEMQHSGYLASAALSHLKSQPRLMVANWGSDIYWFQHKKRHRKKLITLLSRADAYSAECHRDVTLANDLGFKGQILPVVPNAGGIDIRATSMIARAVPTSQRMLILIKGYTNFVGRAQRILSELPNIRHEISDFKIVVYSATLRARMIVWYLRNFRGVDNILAIPKRRLTHSEMLNMFSIARIYVGFSLSDGISTSMLEAMALGCYPIQTCTACANEWVERGSHISVVSPENPSQVTSEIVRIIKLAARVDSLTETNRLVVESHADSEIISRNLAYVYESVMMGTINSDSTSGE